MSLSNVRPGVKRVQAPKIGVGVPLAPGSLHPAEAVEKKPHDFFFKRGMGWDIADGEIVYHRSAPFVETTPQAAEVLANTGLPAAANEIQEALRDIWRRPKPDLTGAIQHAVCALECIAREVTGKRNLTLGRLIPRLGLTPPLDIAVEKCWGYASEHARHIREGQFVTSEEAEFVVRLACSLCILLARRIGADD